MSAFVRPGWRGGRGVASSSSGSGNGRGGVKSFDESKYPPMEAPPKPTQQEQQIARERNALAGTPALTILLCSELVGSYACA
jgi:hypothetical protein